MAAEDPKQDEYAAFDPYTVWRERVLEARRRAEIQRPLASWEPSAAKESPEPLTAAGVLPG